MRSTCSLFAIRRLSTLFATPSHSTQARYVNSPSDYQPVDGSLASSSSSASSSSAASERSRTRRSNMLGQIGKGFGGGEVAAEAGGKIEVDDGGLPINLTSSTDGLPPAANKARFSALDDNETGGASASSPHTISGWASSPLVKMEEGPIPGVYIIRIDNPPVNTCTIEVLRGLLYCLYKLAATFENDVKDAAKPNPWEQAAAAKVGGGLPSATAHLNRCRGIILHSSVTNIFSAGMDLEQLLTVGADAEAERRAAEEKTKGNEEAAAAHLSDLPSHPSIPVDPTTHNEDGKRVLYASFVQYWGTLQHFHHTLLGFPVPAVAAISGDAPAGGCLMSMLCDYRVMAAQPSSSASSSSSTPSSSASSSSPPPPPPARLFKIGMTSARAGFVVPDWIAATLRYTVGPRFAEEILTQSKMVTAEEAKHRYGLIDQISESDDTVLLDALAAMEYILANVPFQHTFWQVKETCRRPLLDMLETKEKRLDDVSRYIAHLSTPSVYKSMRAYKDGLSKSKKE